jgi:glycolate oxidase iron-sulfur subunit
VDKAREQLEKTGKMEVIELPGGSRCCGQGGLFHVAHPDISAAIRDQLVQDVLALKPDVVTSTCSGCLMQWQQGLVAAGSEIKVLHLAELLKYPTPSARRVSMYRFQDIKVNESEKN